MGLAVLGLQQSSVWGWGNPITWICIAAGVAVLVAFVLYQLRIENPLIQVRIFADRAFAADNAILFLLMIPFIPLFFFASMYAQISLGESASETGLYLLIFFAGFATASQWGGQDARQSGGPRSGGAGLRRRHRRLRPLGALAARPLGQLAVVLDRPRRSWGRPGAQPGQHRRAQPRARQPLRRGDGDHANGAQLRLQPRHGGARHGPDPAEQVEPRVDGDRPRRAEGEPPTKSPTQSARAVGASEAPAHVSGALAKVVDNIPHDFALATQTVFYAMAGVMALAFVVSLATMQPGKVEEQVAEAGDASRLRRRGATFSP